MQTARCKDRFGMISYIHGQRDGGVSDQVLMHWKGLKIFVAVVHRSLLTLSEYASRPPQHMYKQTVVPNGQTHLYRLFRQIHLHSWRSVLHTTGPLDEY